MIQGREQLAVVDLLAAQDGEVFQRSLTSRAYYAAYLEARSLCEDHLGFMREARGQNIRKCPGSWDRSTSISVRISASCAGFGTPPITTPT
ncbi:MAG TPA: hypothetical protein VNP95_05095 [Thermomicrobiales bacterium]|nr:hypothetical protein [Thermomicrobiales bacterium]